MRIPRRLSVGEMNTDRTLRAIGERVQITVDGVQQNRCLSYNQDTGEVVRYAMTEGDRFMYDGDNLLTEVVKGVVEVTLKDA